MATRPRTSSRRSPQSRDIARNRSNKSNSSQKKQSQVKEKSKTIKHLPVEDATSLGEAIQRATTIPQFMSIIDNFVWLPTDEDLPSHLRTQAVHHEKRRRWGGQLLEGIGNAVLEMWETDPKEIMLQVSPGGALRYFWTDRRLLRAILSVSSEFSQDSVQRPNKEGVWISSALKGLHVLSCCISPTPPAHDCSDEFEAWINIHKEISKLIQYADSLLSDERTTMKDTVEVRWAIRGLVARLQIANNRWNTADSHEIKSKEHLPFITPHINARASKLPFDILPHCLPWQMKTPSELGYTGYPGETLVQNMLESIPFNFDILTTRTGNSVVERRGTAWLAEEGIGALAYSGKLMKPQHVPDNVKDAMRDIEHWCFERGVDSRSTASQIIALSNGNAVEILWNDKTSNNLPFQQLGNFIETCSDEKFFDCALCNHYPDGDSACKFHTDPEHGSHWHRTTAVVSLGTSRKFAFRPIPDISTWNEWDHIDSELTEQTRDDTSCAPAAVHLFPGDVVLMSGSCNDAFHHAVYASPFDGSDRTSSRVSLVLKKALDRGGGKKGHSLAGEGRRKRKVPNK